MKAKKPSAVSKTKPTLLARGEDIVNVDITPNGATSQPLIVCSDYITDQELDQMTKELSLSGRFYPEYPTKNMPSQGKKLSLAALNAMSGIGG